MGLVSEVVAVPSRSVPIAESFFHIKQFIERMLKKLDRSRKSSDLSMIKK